LFKDTLSSFAKLARKAPDGWRVLGFVSAVSFALWFALHVKTWLGGCMMMRVIVDS
jgi:hypothetical protein